MSRAKRSLTKAAVVLLLGVVAFTAVIAAALLVPLPMDKLQIPPSTCVYDAEGRLMSAFLAPDDRWRITVSYEDVSTEFLDMLIAYEDRWFFWHFGVNPLSLCRALIQNIRAGKIVSGGSTLTMQVARLLDPKPRTVPSKVKEVFQAIGLELRYSKKQILSMYLNLAPYGGNIEGIGAASLLYFGKEPIELSTAEAALLVALPRSPEALRPDRFPDAARRARDTVLKRAFDREVIDEPLFTAALLTDVPTGRRELPKRAQHLSRYLAHRYGPGNIYSTISLPVQSDIEALLSKHVDSLRAAGISNGSVVVIDNISHEIVAYVGSADFYDAEASGQVDGVRAARSPGSTLKPFIYAIAMDQGLITPKSYLEDVPVSYSGYSPQNYSGTFSGVVSAASALTQSINVPAVNLLASIGVDKLFTLLRTAGVSSLSDRHTYGLSMAIGGCEISLLELTGLYSMLANGGTLYRPRLVRRADTQEHPSSPPITLLSEESAFLVSEILSTGSRPDLPSAWESTSLPKIAWKTGTSYGHRDAWCIGYSSGFTVGVWLGNFSGEGSSSLVGAEVASPLLFKIIGRLSKGSTSEWLTPPQSLARREVCSLSGMPAGPLCPETTVDYYIPDVSSNQVCNLHRVALIDESTGLRVPDYLRGTPGIAERVYVEWPASVVAWYVATGVAGVDMLPPLDPKYATKISGAPPRIISPQDNRTYQLRKGLPPEQQRLALIAEANVKTAKLYWFINGELVGTSKPGEAAFYTPVPGTHELVCQDELGRIDKMNLVILPPS